VGVMGVKQSSVISAGDPVVHSNSASTNATQAAKMSVILIITCGIIVIFVLFWFLRGFWKLREVHMQDQLYPKPQQHYAA
jgi:hypothetical protein